MGLFQYSMIAIIPTMPAVIHAHAIRKIAKKHPPSVISLSSLNSHIIAGMANVAPSKYINIAILQSSISSKYTLMATIANESNVSHEHIVTNINSITSFRDHSMITTLCILAKETKANIHPIMYMNSINVIGSSSFHIQQSIDRLYRDV